MPTSMNTTTVTTSASMETTLATVSNSPMHGQDFPTVATVSGSVVGLLFVVVVIALLVRCYKRNRAQQQTRMKPAEPRTPARGGSVWRQLERGKTRMSAFFGFAINPKLIGGETPNSSAASSFSTSCSAISTSPADPGPPLEPAPPPPSTPLSAIDPGGPPLESAPPPPSSPLSTIADGPPLEKVPPVRPSPRRRGDAGSSPDHASASPLGLHLTSSNIPLLSADQASPPHSPLSPSSSLASAPGPAPTPSQSLTPAPAPAPVSAPAPAPVSAPVAPVLNYRKTFLTQGPVRIIGLGAAELPEQLKHLGNKHQSNTLDKTSTPPPEQPAAPPDQPAVPPDQPAPPQQSAFPQQPGPAQPVPAPAQAQAPPLAARSRLESAGIVAGRAGVPYKNNDNNATVQPIDGTYVRVYEPTGTYLCVDQRYENVVSPGDVSEYDNHLKTFPYENTKFKGDHELYENGHLVAPPD